MFCIPFFNVIFFPLYDLIKKTLIKRLDFKDKTFSLYATSAGVGGLLSNIMTNPLWVMRTRMQAEIFRGTSEAQYNSKYGQNMF